MAMREYRGGLLAMVPPMLLTIALLAPMLAAQADEPVEAQIEAVLARYAAAKEARAYDTLADFWDANDPKPFYLAEEMARPATDWQALQAYWDATRDASGWIDVDYTLIDIKPMGPDEVLIFLDLRWDMTFEGFERPIGGSNRTLAGLRRVDGEWRFHTWVEAPLAAYFYLRELYQLNVRPEVLEQQGEPSPWK